MATFTFDTDKHMENNNAEVACKIAVNNRGR
jgi:hypothetical protein